MPSEDKQKATSAGRGKIYDSILQTIGGTPLVRLPRFMEKYKPEADILAKLEFFNPLASVKDRTVLAMVEAAEQAGKIAPGRTTLVEPTSGGTAIALAFIAAAKGYHLILTFPENVSFERRKLLAFFGAELVITPADQGMRGAVEKAKSFLARTRVEHYSFHPFENAAGPDIHARTTAEEIWTDTEGKADILVAGVGTGATITGIARALKARKPGFRAYAVEPAESAVLSGEKPTQHQIQGLGAGFVPAVYDKTMVDGIVKIASAQAFATAQDIALLDGVPGGISSGAALAAAIEVAKMPENKGKMIVTIFPSFAERYISTPLFDKAAS